VAIEAILDQTGTGPGRTPRLWRKRSVASPLLGLLDVVYRALITDAAPVT